MISLTHTRCKKCGKEPIDSIEISSLSYHAPGPGKNAGSNRFQSDVRFFRNQINIFDKSPLRKSSLRGVCSLSSFYFKKHKNNFGNARKLICCPCGLSTWMYPNHNFDFPRCNRTMECEYPLRKRKNYPKGANPGRT